MTSGGRGLTVKISVGLVLLAVASLLLPVSAQAEESSGAPSFILVSESTLALEDSSDWAAAAAVTAKAHAEHPQGSLFATYRKLTGGPGETVRTLFPFDKMGDLDEWVSNRQILYETVGEEQGQLVLDDLNLSADADERILAYSQRLSRPRDVTRAPKFLWVVEVQVVDGSMAEYAALATRLKDANEQAGSSRFWLTYGNALGGARSELTYLYGFDTFATLDGWPSWREVLTKAYSAEEAARLAAALESLAETRTSLWALEPELSQMESE